MKRIELGCDEWDGPEVLQWPRREARQFGEHGPSQLFEQAPIVRIGKLARTQMIDHGGREVRAR